MHNWRWKTILFLSSQTISLFGSSLVQYAIMWHITLNTKSGIMMTISIICGFLPMFFLSPFAGVWADRYNRKILIMLADSFIALATLLVAVLFFMGYDSVWLLFAVSAVRAVGSGLQNPAVGAMVPQIVPQDRLVRVNAINSSVQSFVTLVSPAVSGALLTFATIEYIFFIDVITAAIAVFILAFFLRIPPHAKAAEKQSVSYFHDLLEGWRYITGHKFILFSCLFNIAYFILIAPAAFLTPLQVAISFGDDVWRLSAIEMAFSLGMMAGGAIIAAWGGFKNKLHTMVLANLMIGFGTFALGVIHIFAIYLALMTLIGISMPIFNTPFTSLIQQKVAEDYLGRVFGVFGMLVSVMMPLGMLIFGPLAEFVRIELMLVATGLLIVVLSFIMLNNKVLLEAGKPAAQKAEGDPEV
ncbi:MAG TPA: MFS transporter [Candidatus Atribacteria bacterium]|nr:MFS transporter [Candidatus Atribacteria bacterium]HPT79318.1 MFS transporter [Candidatus Atribacteria bacterium]